MREEIRKSLLEMGEKKLAEFSGRLIPGAENIIGVRLPELRKYAKRLAREMGEEAIDGEDIFYEEIMLRGFVIGYLRTDPEHRLELIRGFIPLIDNWAVCDSFCPTLSFTKKNPELVREFLEQYLASEKEFEQRFGVVMLRCYYINDQYIDSTLASLTAVDTGQYYSSMAVAWAVSECYIKYTDKTIPLLENKSLNPVTHNRAISKICDSFRVSSDEKNKLRALKQMVN